MAKNRQGRAVPIAPAQQSQNNLLKPLIAVILVIAVLAFFYSRSFTPSLIPTPVAVPELPSATPTPEPTPEATAAPTEEPVATPEPAVEPTLVEIFDFYYKPVEVNVSIGDTVLWRNRGGVLHTVTSSDRVFSSPNLGTGMEFNYTFSQAGSFKYYDSLHAGPVGWVHVSG